ncbi:shufflon system plasmid conjugative transfer pilus tip adhesin PilV [Aquimarina sp. AD10]|uniref:shufflon system plasmid conjugative transfer pilus tip adhesin PilV n=1 Tax=Aquimarina sp. AD10 TaxID=1714849 RepID=UPI000E5294B8|nr:shufflon system plasmid conjugative transfer pilus tip adhesin PilV [Aquimarina sp. AD10]AXT61364.1 shufflon system plasmid conjugative transfer pilus tip adhesin PilV [Aquimarina sp. AD10]RKN01442.1 shufflon system plasmid conjugative transfer pilus tip adhesin PilV [Aquimarina sp. AD10]
MKKITILIIVCLNFITVQAQITELPDGNVGIGTTAPSAKFHVNGTTAIDNLYSNHSSIRFGHDLNDRIIADNSPSKIYGGGYFLRVHNEEIGHKYVDVMMLSDEGNVGIGTKSPLGKLHINGETYIDNGWMRIKGQKGLFFQDYGGGFYMKDDSWIRTYGNKNFYHNTGVMRTDGIFQVGGSGDRFIVDAIGKVGIGNTSPKASLHISSSVTSLSSTQNIDANLIIEGKSNDRTTSKGASLGFVIPANTNGSNLWQQGRILVTPDNTRNANASGRMHLQTRALNSQGNAWEWKNNLVLRSSGNVGIGTTAPDSKLTVKGKIHAEEVKIDLSVPAPDYVFKKEYNLLSIAEVQQHIKDNGHLPNIPSAKEMEKNGVELGIMNMKLLEKIEELTLYTIDQEKRLKDQEAEIQNLKSEKIEMQKLSEKIISLEKLIKS